MGRNSVHQSTSSWWVVRKFLNSLRMVVFMSQSTGIRIVKPLLSASCTRLSPAPPAASPTPCRACLGRGDRQQTEAHHAGREGTADRATPTCRSLVRLQSCHESRMVLLQGRCATLCAALCPSRGHKDEGPERHAREVVV